MTIADTFRAEGEVRGKAEGKAEGKAQGRGELLLEQLEFRFKPLPGDVPARVRAGSGEQLSTWARRILEAKTLGEVFGDQPAG